MTSPESSCKAPEGPRLVGIMHGPYRWLALLGGIAALSTASILIRLAEAPPLAIGAWRMLLATALLTPWALPRLRRERSRLARRDILFLCLSGTALAIHFAAWISSLAYTTVASSVILVTTNPIYVGLASHYLLKERLGGAKVIAIIVALAGSVVIGYGDFDLSARALWGDALALLGALAASTYILSGRVVRRQLSTLAYVWPCYGLAGSLLLALCLLSGQALSGYNSWTYLMFFLLAVAPQIVGHSAINWALDHVSPILVTLAILGEPIGASILALLVLGETPPASALIGGLLILAGICLASREESARLN